MTASAASSAVPHHPGLRRPASVDRAARTWWVALASSFTATTVAQLAHGPAALSLRYPYATLQQGPAPVVLAGLYAVFLASLVLPLRDGSGWSRPLLVVLALPLLPFDVWQFGRSVGTAMPTGASVIQALLGVLTLVALPAAAGLMYRADVTAYIVRGSVDNR